MASDGFRRRKAQFQFSGAYTLLSLRAQRKRKQGAAGVPRRKRKHPAEKQKSGQMRGKRSPEVRVELVLSPLSPPFSLFFPVVDGMSSKLPPPEMPMKLFTEGLY